jgi:hypothetical protein
MSNIINRDTVGGHGQGGPPPRFGEKTAILSATTKAFVLRSGARSPGVLRTL